MSFRRVNSRIGSGSGGGDGAAEASSEWASVTDWSDLPDDAEVLSPHEDFRQGSYTVTPYSWASGGLTITCNRVESWGSGSQAYAPLGLVKSAGLGAVDVQAEFDSLTNFPSSFGAYIDVLVSSGGTHEDDTFFGVRMQWTGSAYQVAKVSSPANQQSFYESTYTTLTGTPPSELGLRVKWDAKTGLFQAYYSEDVDGSYTELGSGSDSVATGGTAPLKHVNGNQSSSGNKWSAFTHARNILIRVGNQKNQLTADAMSVRLTALRNLL